MVNFNIIEGDDLFESVHDELIRLYNNGAKASVIMKKLNITKEQFNRSRYFRNKYGELEYVSESGRLFKTNKGKILMFNESIKKFGKKFTNESSTDDIYGFYEWLKFNTMYDSGIQVRYHDNEDGTESLEMTFDDRFDWGDDVEDGNLPKEQSENYQHWLQMFDRQRFSI